MGASQSSTDGAESKAPLSNRADMKTCYYELLGINRHATEEEVKKAYRKKALELHPDRNFGDVEESTQLFAEIQAAYQVLSDVQERAWYDSHRDAILRGDEEDTADQYEHNIRVSTVDDVLRIFTKFDGRLEYSDSPSGFFSILRTFFSTLADEEVAASDWDGRESPELGSFGYANDDFDGPVKAFYANWTSFATTKTFSWKDIYRYSEAPDRRVRRMMEKENKKRRDEGIREFNDAVRSLVAFVKKRDPRYKANRQSEAERQKILRDATLAQAARARAQNLAKMQEHIEPAWSRAQEEEPLDEKSEGEQSPEECFECVVCAKIFKSEKQYEMHERSKKHLKSVALMKRQMRSDNTALDLDLPIDAMVSKLDLDGEPERFTSASSPPKHEAPIDTRKLSGDDQQISSETSLTFANVDEKAKDRSHTGAETFDLIENGVQSDGRDSLVIDDQASSDSREDYSRLNVKKLGKAKEKRMKKAAQQVADSQATEETKCITCGQIFLSKTKLFGHIKELDHAQPTVRSVKGGKKRKT